MIPQHFQPSARSVAGLALLFWVLAYAHAAEDQPLDFQRARQLFERDQKGETLSPEDEAYLEQARQEMRRRQQQKQGNNQPGQPGRPGANMGPVPPPRSSTGLIPLTELGTEKYKGEDGGLYGGGSNEPPAEHRAAVEKQLKLVQPRDERGNPAADGKIVLLSIGLSNTTLEFQVFKRKADADPKKSPRVVIVDGAQPGRGASFWAHGLPGVPPGFNEAAAKNIDPWPVVDQRLRNAGVSPHQVQVTWIKGDPQLNFDAEKGAVTSPAVLWGPYLWTDGVKPRQGDQLAWLEEDVVPEDRTHPSESGREKVANLLLNFLHNNPLASCWYLGTARDKTSAVERPRGIFILDSRSGTPYRDGTLRDANVRDYPFVDGYVLRASWASMEPAKGQYDFKVIDNILAKLPKGQRLSLILLLPDPGDIAATAGVTTWQDQERRGTRKLYFRAVPWDPVLRERRHAFIEALAGHKTDGVALRDNPVLVAINPFLPGAHGGIRDPMPVHLKDLPGYSRTKLLATVQDELRLLTNQFPRTFVQIGFWKVEDNQEGRSAWEEIRSAIMGEFNATANPRVGFFMENLAASRPAPGKDPVTGRPITEFGAPLFLSREQTWIAFQALTCWKRPFTDPSKVANGTPADGMQYALDTYGCVYFEHYLLDIENPAWRDDLQKWHERLAAGKR